MIDNRDDVVAKIQETFKYDAENSDAAKKQVTDWLTGRAKALRELMINYRKHCQDCAKSLPGYRQVPRRWKNLVQILNCFIGDIVMVGSVARGFSCLSSDVDFCFCSLHSTGDDLNTDYMVFSNHGITGTGGKKREVHIIFEAFLGFLEKIIYFKTISLTRRVFELRMQLSSSELKEHPNRPEFGSSIKLVMRPAVGSVLAPCEPIKVDIGYSAEQLIGADLLHADNLLVLRDDSIRGPGTGESPSPRARYHRIMQAAFAAAKHSAVASTNGSLSSTACMCLHFAAFEGDTSECAARCEREESGGESGLVRSLDIRWLHVDTMAASATCDGNSLEVDPVATLSSSIQRVRTRSNLKEAPYSYIADSTKERILHSSRDADGISINVKDIHVCLDKMNTYKILLESSVEPVTSDRLRDTERKIFQCFTGELYFDSDRVVLGSLPQPAGCRVKRKFNVKNLLRCLRFMKWDTQIQGLETLEDGQTAKHIISSMDMLEWSVKKLPLISSINGSLVLDTPGGSSTMQSTKVELGCIVKKLQFDFQALKTVVADALMLRDQLIPYLKSLKAGQQQGSKVSSVIAKLEQIVQTASANADFFYDAQQLIDMCHCADSEAAYSISAGFQQMDHPLRREVLPQLIGAADKNPKKTYERTEFLDFAQSLVVGEKSTWFRVDSKDKFGPKPQMAHDLSFIFVHSVGQLYCAKYWENKINDVCLAWEILDHYIPDKDLSDMFEWVDTAGCSEFMRCKKLVLGNPIGVPLERSPCGCLGVQIHDITEVRSEVEQSIRILNAWNQELSVDVPSLTATPEVALGPNTQIAAATEHGSPGRQADEMAIQRLSGEDSGPEDERPMPFYSSLSDFPRHYFEQIMKQMWNDVEEFYSTVTGRSTTNLTSDTVTGNNTITIDEVLFAFVAFQSQEDADRAISSSMIYTPSRRRVFVKLSDGNNFVRTLYDCRFGHAPDSSMSKGSGTTRLDLFINVLQTLIDSDGGLGRAAFECDAVNSVKRLVTEEIEHSDSLIEKGHPQTQRNGWRCACCKRSRQVTPQLRKMYTPKISNDAARGLVEHLPTCSFRMQCPGTCGATVEMRRKISIAPQDATLSDTSSKTIGPCGAID